MAENKVAKEVAEAEFERFIKAHDLDADTSDMSEEDRKEFEDRKRPIIRAIERGALSFDGDGLPTFQPSDGGEPLKFHEPTGKTMLAGKSGMSDTAKLFATLGSLTNEQPIRFERIAARDVKVCASLLVLLFS